MFLHPKPLCPPLSALCLLFGLFFANVSILAAEGALPDRRKAISYGAQSGNATWKKVEREDPRLSSRELYSYALALLESKTHTERVDKLIALGAKMQDRNPENRSYGNFLWYQNENEIRDYNAVEFSMMGGALVWIRHRESLSPPTRAALRETMEFAAQACLTHRVRSSYTNISLMNALNLMLLGETLGKTDVADEGYRRFERFCFYVWENGIHEYNSPTYYGVDLECLSLIERFCGREEGREAARVLLELFWTDIALNWFEPLERLGGACSREYRYINSGGPLDVSMWLQGWLPPEEFLGGVGVVFPALGRWGPGSELREQNRSDYPRLVRQKWGEQRAQARTHFIQRDVTLSSSAANYGAMDLPLTVDLPGERGEARCYFIPDGRSDPYGKVKIAAGAHQKARHLQPFWTAAQRGGDALGLVVYRPGDLADDLYTLESHFVMRRNVDGFWIGGERIFLGEGQEVVHRVAVGEAVVLRQGAAAVGIRVLRALTMDGKTATIRLINDANSFGVVRLTIDHFRLTPWNPNSSSQAMAALWVRIGSGLKSDRSFLRWEREFSKAAWKSSLRGDSLQTEADGIEGKLKIEVTVPFTAPAELVPEPTQGVLELNGKDLGREILKKLKVIQDFLRKRAEMKAIALPASEGIYFEAEAGLVSTGMEVAPDPEGASGGKFVRSPGEPGGKGNKGGGILWKLRVEEEGTYYLWGRVLTPTKEDDSFYVRLSAPEGAEILPATTWSTGIHTTWAWTPVRLDPAPGPTPLKLPGGGVNLEFPAREDGAAIDRLFLTPDPSIHPQ